MQSIDRVEFRALLEKLCAGFNVPLTEPREEAYWTGAAKMTLLQFSRVVDHSLGPDGAEKLPTSAQLWKSLRALRQPAPRELTEDARDRRDHLLYFANRIFFAILSRRGGMGSTGEPSNELMACRKVVVELVEYFAQPVREGDPDATPYGFISALVRGLQRVTTVDPVTLQELRNLLHKPDARVPFPPYMGRPLSSPERTPTQGNLNAQA